MAAPGWQAGTGKKPLWRKGGFRIATNMDARTSRLQHNPRHHRNESTSGTGRTALTKAAG